MITVPYKALHNALKTYKILPITGERDAGSFPQEKNLWSYQWSFMAMNSKPRHNVPTRRCLNSSTWRGSGKGPVLESDLDNGKITAGVAIKRSREMPGKGTGGEGRFCWIWGGCLGAAWPWGEFQLLPAERDAPSASPPAGTG